jgi:hypothetical protein
MKQLTISPREAEIYAHATGFRVWHKTLRSGVFADEQVARMVAKEAADTDGRKALVYAMDANGADAMIASYCQREGWNNGVVK